MRTFLAVLGILAIAIASIIAWNWWESRTTDLRIVYPTEGAALAGDSVPVRLAAEPEVRAKLALPGQAYQIVTYLNGKEIGRGQQLEYTLTAVPPGEHRLEVALSEQTQANSVSLNVMPRAVNFTLGGGSGAAHSLPPGVSSNASAPVPPDPTAPAVYAVPAQPQPETAARPNLPASGLGGASAPALASKPAPAIAAGDSPKITNPQPRIEAGQSSLPVASTQVKTQANPATLDKAGQTSNGGQEAMVIVFRWLAAFYVAAFIVALAAMLAIKRKNSY